MHIHTCLEKVMPRVSRFNEANADFLLERGVSLFCAQGNNSKQDFLKGGFLTLKQYTQENTKERKLAFTEKYDINHGGLWVSSGMAEDYSLRNLQAWHIRTPIEHRTPIQPKEEQSSFLLDLVVLAQKSNFQHILAHTVHGFYGVYILDKINCTNRNADLSLEKDIASFVYLNPVPLWFNFGITLFCK